MRLFNGIVPVVGKDQYGNPINLVVDKESARTVQARNIQSVGASETTANPSADTQTETNATPMKQIDITSIYSKDGKTLALGKGVFRDNAVKDIAYTNVNGTWVIGLSPITETPRPNGIAYTNNNFVVATNSKTIISDFKYNSNTATSNGVVLTLPTNKLAALGGAKIDNLSAGTSVLVGGSTSQAGTWITKATLPSDEWGKHVGEQELILTNTKATSYTFPGYAKADPQIQRVCALPNGDKPPVDWVTGDDRTNGYYGVIGAPVITVTWTKSA